MFRISINLVVALTVLITFYQSWKEPTVRYREVRHEDRKTATFSRLHNPILRERHPRTPGGYLPLFSLQFALT